jgi:putative FmdB family regulatory protein
MEKCIVMPMFQYDCPYCKDTKDKIQPYSDTRLVVCSHCGAEMKRAVSSPNFQLIGKGWAKDNYTN